MNGTADIDGDFDDSQAIELVPNKFNREMQEIIEFENPATPNKQRRKSVASNLSGY